MSKESIEEQKKEARDYEEVMDYIIDLIEKNDERFSFTIGAGSPIGGLLTIFDKEKDTAYAIRIEKIQYDENDNPVNI